MEAQLHHDDPHHPAVIINYTGADLHKEDEHGVEKKSTIKNVKAKVHNLKATIKHGHGHHHDEEQHNDAERIMNESPAIRSGLMQPTDMGKPVLAEDLHATHSDIVDTPVRSFAQWEEEERHGAPPPLPTGINGQAPLKVGVNQNVNREQLKGSIGISSGMEEHPSAPHPPTAVSPANRQAQVPGPTTKTDRSQVGHHGFDQDLNREQLIGKSTGMVQDPSAPNPTTAVSPANHQTKVTDPTKTAVEDAPISTVAGDPTSHSSRYTKDKAAMAKDLMVSKLDSSGENKSVAERVTGTLGPVYETVVGVGSSVVSKMQGSEKPATTRITEKKEGGSVKDYLVETLRPGDEDKVVSDVITHTFHRNDPPVQEITATSIYVRDEGGDGRSVQESRK
ncbi:hypothetical protein L6452_14798 [Arctium lappa]|uniref:Uncharacterized protein n=1 Tax=Arctium lappa TaxID=4217 RepID=A0ACB9CMA1_ARCLA|nr:hypothetical protein L6452_14798 [Arctium lappa]